MVDTISQFRIDSAKRISAFMNNASPAAHTARPFRNFWLGLGLAIGSLAICVFIGEITCRVFFPDRQLRYMSDPETLARFAPNQNGELTIADGASTFDIQINDLGFRDSASSSWSGRRILMLGDSFTFGWGVLDHQSFPSLVGHALPPSLKVANGGQPGFGVYQIQATLERVVPQIKPELVVVILWEGLLARQPLDASEREAFIRKSTLIRNAKSLSVLGTHVYRRLETLLSKNGLNNYIVTMSAHTGAGASEFDSQLPSFWERDSARILSMQKLLEARGARLALVLWPRAGFSEPANLQASRDLENRVSIFAQEHKIPYLSLSPAFQGRSKDELLLPIDYHPTVLAHCLVGKALSEFLRSLGYPPEHPITCN